VPHRRKRRSDRGGAHRGHGRPHRRHHLHGRYARRQQSARPRGRADHDQRSPPDRVADGGLDAAAQGSARGAALDHGRHSRRHLDAALGVPQHIRARNGLAPGPGRGTLMATADLELTILMPCLNEAETLAVCIGKASDFLARTGIAGEVLVADNGSSDGSQEIAERAGARVVDIAEKGYGAALAGGIAAARGRYVIMGDADDSYDFANLDAFVEKLRAGTALVMGNRFKGGIAPGAMPWHHRHIGNPVLSFLGRLFFRTRASDFHSGLRGFDRQAIIDLNLRTTVMEVASEMLVKATLSGLLIAEVPTTLEP